VKTEVWRLQGKQSITRAGVITTEQTDGIYLMGYRFGNHGDGQMGE
jgi:hypothetical protein